MAEKKPAKPAKSSAKSKRGGARANAGRKPKAVEEFRDGLIAGLIAPPAEEAIQPTSAGGPRLGAIPGGSAAERAIRLFERVMDDEGGQTIDIRLRAAKELLDRVIGKPRQAVDVKSEGTGPQVIFVIPDNGRDGAAGSE